MSICKMFQRYFVDVLSIVGVDGSWATMMVVGQLAAVYCCQVACCSYKDIAEVTFLEVNWVISCDSVMLHNTTSSQ